MESFPQRCLSNLNYKMTCIHTGTHLNLNSFYAKFPDIFEKIFENFNNKDLESSIEVSKSWMQWTDNQNIPSYKIALSEDGSKVFQLAKGLALLTTFLPEIREFLGYGKDSTVYPNTSQYLRLQGLLKP